VIIRARGSRRNGVTQRGLGWHLNPKQSVRFGVKGRETDGERERKREREREREREGGREGGKEGENEGAMWVHNNVCAVRPHTL